MSELEVHQSPPEAEINDNALPKAPERPLDKIKSEHKDIQNEQSLRASEEEVEHREEETAVEKMLENEMMKETYDEMKNSLQGDAREVFHAVEAQLSDQEKIDLAHGFNGFMEVADKEIASVGEKLHHVPKEATIARLRMKRSVNISNCFQNSIDYQLRIHQGIDEDAPRNEIERLGQTINEHVRESYKITAKPSDEVVWGKVKVCMAKFIKEERVKNPTRVFRGLKREPPLSLEDGNIRMDLDKAADIYEAVNLDQEIKRANDAGIGIRALNEEGVELTNIKEMADVSQIRIEITPPKELTLSETKKVMNKGLFLVTENAKNQIFEGDKFTTEESVEKLVAALKEKKSKSP